MKKRIFRRTNSNVKVKGGHVMLKRLEGQVKVLAILWVPRALTNDMPTNESQWRCNRRSELFTFIRVLVSWGLTTISISKLSLF